MIKLKVVAKFIFIILLLACVIGLSFGLVKNCSGDDPVDPDDPNFVAVEDIDLDETNIIF